MLHLPWKKEYGHRNVFDEVYEFCGFKALATLLKECPKDETKLLVLSLFKTGGRISEVLTLEGKQIRSDDRWVYVRRMPVLKRRAGEFRDVVFPLDEPLTEDWVSLMPSNESFFQYKYDKYYKDICNLQKPEGSTHGPWFPHRFRAERARQLMKDYNFEVTHLQRFFNMARTDTPVEYVRPHIEDLKRLMQKR